jgi:hypothetical protein
MAALRSALDILHDKAGAELTLGLEALSETAGEATGAEAKALYTISSVHRVYGTGEN